MEKTFDAWITKYALTKGIIKIRAEKSSDSMIEEIGPDGNGVYNSYYHGNDWHITEHDAIEQAKKMQVRKIASLERSLNKIKALKF